jgi:hypothetical protein
MPEFCGLGWSERVCWMWGIDLVLEGAPSRQSLAYNVADLRGRAISSSRRLDVDREYREQPALDKLRKIARAVSIRPSRLR